MKIKELIKALLQTKFGGVQLSDARVDALAKRLEGKVKDEAELEARLVILDESTPFADIAKEDDRARSQQAELEKLKKPAPQPPALEPAPAPTEEIPAWAKALIDGQKAVTETVTALQGQKVVNDRRSLISSKLKDAGEDYSNKVLRDFGRMSFADDAAFEEYLGDIEKDYTTHVQTQAESKLGNDAPLKGITDSSGQVSDATVTDIVNNL